MQISRPYTVVLPSLQVDPSEREFDGRRFYLMIKIYPEGTLTPTLNPVVAGEFHNFQHSLSVLGGLLPPWVFKSKTMSLKLWLTLKEFSLLKKICINDEKLVHLYGSIISKFFLSHLAVRGANLFQGASTIANVKVFLFELIHQQSLQEMFLEEVQSSKIFLSTANFPKFVYNLHNFVS